MAYSEGRRGPQFEDLERLSQLDLQILQGHLVESSDIAFDRIEEINDILSDERDPAERTKLEEERSRWLAAREENRKKLDEIAKKLKYNA